MIDMFCKLCFYEEEIIWNLTEKEGGEKKRKERRRWASQQLPISSIILTHSELAIK